MLTKTDRCVLTKSDQHLNGLEKIGGESLTSVGVLQCLLPEFGKELKNSVSRPVRKKNEDVAEIAPRFDSMETRRGDERCEDAIPFAAVFASQEEPIQQGMPGQNLPRAETLTYEHQTISTDLSPKTVVRMQLIGLPVAMLQHRVCGKRYSASQSRLLLFGTGVGPIKALSVIPIKTSSV